MKKLLLISLLFAIVPHLAHAQNGAYTSPKNSSGGGTPAGSTPDVQINNAGSFGAISTPTSPDGVPHFYTTTSTGGVAGTPTTSLAGVPVNNHSETTCATQTLDVLDRATAVICSGGTTATFTFPVHTTAGFGNNFPFLLLNANSGDMTLSPTTDTIDSATLHPHWGDHIYQNASGNWQTAQFPLFAAFPNCTDTGGNHLNFTSTTGLFSCGTSGGGGTSAISGLTDAAANHSVNLAGFEQTWNCTTAATTPCLLLTEPSASAGAGPLFEFLGKASSLATLVKIIGTNATAVASAPPVLPDLFDVVAARGADCTSACVGGDGQSVSITAGDGGDTNGTGNNTSNGGSINFQAGKVGTNTAVTHQQNWGKFNFNENYQSPYSSGIGFAASPGIWLNNTAAAVIGTNPNNGSLSVFSSVHVDVGGLDTVVRSVNYTPFPCTAPSTNSVGTTFTGAGPNYCSGVQTQGQATGTKYYFTQQPGGVSLFCVGSGTTVCGSGGVAVTGGTMSIGDAVLQVGAINFATAALGASTPNFVFFDHGNSGVADAAIEDDNVNNGTMVFESYLVNGSGATINDGSPVKMSATANQVTPTVTTDAASSNVSLIGFNVGSCASGATCHIAWHGRLNGVATVGTGHSCAVGNFVIVDSAVNQDVNCTATFAAGQVLGIATTAATAGQHPNIVIGVR